jgi:hypothetical protein
VTDGGTDSGRDARGRFGPGNPGGPGGSRRRACELRMAAEEAVTPEMVKGAMRKCAMLALQGNLSALRILLERALGKPLEASVEGEPLDIAPPRLRTAADCSTALERVTDAICKGSIDYAAGKLLIDAITARIRVLEVTELEARLTELEKQAASVDFGGRR